MPASMKNSPELTQEEVIPFLVKPLEAASVVLAAGPRIFDSPTGDPLRIPTLVSVGDAAWHGENELITEADPDFGEITLLPNNLKSVKVMHRFSNELARHSVISIATTLQSALVRQVADKLDDALLAGTGALDGNGNRTPIGLFNQAGIQTGTWSTTPSAAEAVDLTLDAVGKFLTAEITDLSRARWFMRPADFIAFGKVKDADGRPLIQPDVTQGFRQTLHGIPVTVTSKLTAGQAALVDMNMVAVGRDLAPSVKILDQTYGDYDQLAIRVVTRQDIGLLHPEGVVLLTDATP